MSPLPTSLENLLRTDPADPGCSAGATLLDIYVDAVSDGRDPATVTPEWTAHLRTCPACRQDAEGLLEAVRLFSD